VTPQEKLNRFSVRLFLFKARRNQLQPVNRRGVSFAPRYLSPGISPTIAVKIPPFSSETKTIFAAKFHNYAAYKRVRGATQTTFNG
jgi:hypothetical protein